MKIRWRCTLNPVKNGMNGLKIFLAGDRNDNALEEPLIILSTPGS